MFWVVEVIGDLYLFVPHQSHTPQTVMLGTSAKNLVPKKRGTGKSHHSPPPKKSDQMYWSITSNVTHRFWGSLCFFISPAITISSYFQNHPVIPSEFWCFSGFFWGGVQLPHLSKWKTGCLGFDRELSEKNKEKHWSWICLRWLFTWTMAFGIINMLRTFLNQTSF